MSSIKNIIYFGIWGFMVGFCLYWGWLIGIELWTELTFKVSPPLTDDALVNSILGYLAVISADALVSIIVGIVLVLITSSISRLENRYFLIIPSLVFLYLSYISLFELITKNTNIAFSFGYYFVVITRPAVVLLIFYGLFLFDPLSRLTRVSK